MSKPFYAKYKSLRTVRCEAPGHSRAATHQVEIDAGGYSQYLALCDECYAEFMAAEREYGRAPRGLAPAPAVCYTG